MGFKRTWDSSCPRVWDSWVENGTEWVIQDLAPEDDETAIQILREHLVPDEALCALSNLSEDPKSIQNVTIFWRESIAKRMTLACYTEVDGKKTLVALNVCIVDTSDDKVPHIQVIMGFKRTWDSSCPRVWDSWVENGTEWVIQDLAPEDDETAIQILREHLVPDEALCALSNLSEDPKSIQNVTIFWRESIAKRMTLACYTEVDGKKTLVALNVCIVDTSDDKVPHIQVDGEAIKNVFGAVMYLENKCDSFEYLGHDVLLRAFGLTVRKEYRGENLGSRLLSARKPLSLAHGIKATSTVFTGPASQKSAARSGFKSICEVSLKELSENGMNFPPDEGRVIKLMVKSFDNKSDNRRDVKNA